LDFMVISRPYNSTDSDTPQHATRRPTSIDISQFGDVDQHRARNLTKPESPAGSSPIPIMTRPPRRSSARDRINERTRGRRRSLGTLAHFHDTRTNRRSVQRQIPLWRPPGTGAFFCDRVPRRVSYAVDAPPPDTGSAATQTRTRRNAAVSVKYT